MATLEELQEQLDNFEATFIHLRNEIERIKTAFQNDTNLQTARTYINSRLAVGGFDFELDDLFREHYENIIEMMRPEYLRLKYLIQELQNG
jgi:hypothetical protein